MPISRLPWPMPPGELIPIGPPFPCKLRALLIDRGTPLFRLCFSLAAALALQACTGLYLSLPDERRDDGPEIIVTPITAELVTKQAPARPEPLPPQNEKVEPWIYHVGIGDILDISIPSIASVPGVASTVSGREQDQGFTVAPDGTIYLPYVGALKVQGSSIRVVQDQVVRGLSRYIKIPQVSVSVRAFRSQKVLIGGQVPKPAYLPITDVPLTLVGALTAVGSTVQLRGDLRARPTTGQSGGQPESGDYSQVRLTRDGTTRILNVLALLGRGSLAGDPVLHDGDVVNVPATERSYVYVLGEVTQPALVEVVQHRTSLAEVLMASGGVKQQSAKAERVYVIRGQFDKPDIFQLNANEPDALLLADAFMLQPRDVVYVAEANISRWNRFLGQLLPTVQNLLTGVVAGNAVGK